MRDAPRPVRCAIYTRQSVARPETAGLSSCVVQRELCQEFIAARRMEGWIALPERFDDEGESGSTMERPALERLLERIEEGGVDRVIIYRLDRITRSLRDWVKLAETLKRHNVSLSSTSGEGLDGADSALVQLMANMIATFAEFEREMISERLSPPASEGPISAGDTGTRVRLGRREGVDGTCRPPQARRRARGPAGAGGLMSGPEFFQTRMGARFYEGTMPKIAEQLERLNANLEALLVTLRKQVEASGVAAGSLQQPNGSK